jgi:hypothetical protein
MNGPRLASLFVLVCLMGPAASVPSVEAQTPVAADAPAELTPSELYRDTKALLVVTKLELTRSQIEKILPVVQTAADQLVADRQADDHAYELVSEAADAVIAALTRGQQPPPRQMSLLDRAARERAEREDFRAGLAANAASQIQRMLTGEQASRIETAAEQAERKAVEARLEGASSPLDYIVEKLNEQMELMPDEYLRTREKRALDMAVAILGEGAPRVGVLARELLAIMDEVASWTPEEYQKARAELPGDIAERLGLPEQEAREILYEDFIAWITSDRTPAVLQELLAARQPEEEGVIP